MSCCFCTVLSPCHACYFHTDFLGRLLLKTPKAARPPGDVKPEKERGVRLEYAPSPPSRRSSTPDADEAQMCEGLDQSALGAMSRHDRSTTPDRKGHTRLPNDRVTSRRGSTQDPDAEQTSDVLDHSMQWRLAASVLDRFFLVVYSFMLIGVSTWTGVNIWGR